jgi:hypothetical protein
MIQVPHQFQQRHPFPYPSDNHSCFEEWFFDHYEPNNEEREYLPVFWTGYYVRADFGTNKSLMGMLQWWLDGLDTSKKYYTIIQYDNGILHNIDHLDIKVFSMSGGRTNYPLPLIAMPHAFSFNFRRRPFFANFIGKITHPIREQILKAQTPGNYILTHKHKLADYCRIIASSTFTLCPRGFGPTSFRIQEALQFGSIPVYISDEFVLPHNLPFEEFGVIIEAKDAGIINEILRSIPNDEIKRRQHAIHGIYSQYFTYDGNKKAIQKEVGKCNHSADYLPV